MAEARDPNQAGRRGGYAGAIPVERGAYRSAYLAAGVVGGLIAGVVFALAEMIAAAMMGIPALMPIRMFASVLLGEAALTPQVATGTAIVVGVIAHFAIAAFWGLVFGWAASAIRGLRGAGSFAVAGAVFGTLVWLIDFYVLAPAFWPWFATANPGVQFLLHALFYGLPLGLWAAYGLERRGVEAGARQP